MTQTGGQHTKHVIDQSKIDTRISNEKRGFQHVYKCKNTPSSIRVHRAHEITKSHGKARNKKAVERSYAKEQKLERELTMVLPSLQQSLADINFSKDSPPIFYSGTESTDTTMYPERIRCGVMLSAVKDLKVVDSISGARLFSDSGDTVFTLIPRKSTITSFTRVEQTLSALDALQRSKTETEKRGKKRLLIPESDGKYVTVGLRANRGCVGISESWPKKLDTKDRKEIRRLMKNCEHVAKGFIPSIELRGLRQAQKHSAWQEMTDATKESIWGSVACGKNYFLNSHVDDDFFYSLTTIVSKYGLRKEIDNYDMDAEVSNYFAFPEQGIAVALRPGDMLIFNPRYQHCLSSRSSCYKNKDVFCLSMYLKTAVVGGNDNSC